MPERKKYPQISFRPEPEMLAALGERGENVNFAARESLERYFYLLGAELSALRGRFSAAEAALMADAVNGWLVEPHTAGLLWAEVDDAVRLDGLAEKWDVDGPGLVQKLRSLTYGQALALLDALGRWWRAPGEATAEGFASVGLIVG